MLQDSRGMFWIGTKQGLSILDNNRVAIQHITMADGLPTNSIVSMLEDEKGNIWLGTSKGLVNVIVEQPGPSSITYKLNTYTEKNGLQGRLFNDNAAFKTDSGDLVFGGPNGFNIIKPDEMKFDHSGSKIVFTQLQIFNKEVKPGDHLNNRPVLTRSMVDTQEIVLQSHENVFSLSFATLNYLEPEDVKYFYKLEGFNNDWIILDRSRENAISYTNLSPGEYVLRVKAEDNTETPEIQITILPPFWKTKYAFVGYFLIILALLWVARKMVISRAKLKFALEEEKKEAIRVHQMDMMKIKFFTNISHEFRTPLSLILSPIERILEKEDNEDNRKQFFLIQRNAKRLMNLVNQLLDFRKIEVQEIKLALTENDIVSFARETCASFSDLSEKKNIDLSFYSKPLKLVTMFDRDKLERIIFNLLSNAFKFTPEGGRISVVLEFEENAVLPNTQTGSLVKLTIKDTGIGIPEDKKEKIFDRFFQNSSPENIVNQGSGIGLSITKEFVQLHGGKIYVESGTEGSSFVVLLPVELSSTNVNSKTDESHFSFKQDELSLQEQTSKFDQKKQKLLIVEDNEDFRFYLKDNLKEEFNILEATNGEQGYKIATLQSPDLIVSDVIMPKLDGFQMTKKIRNDLRTNHIPIILLTSSSKEEQKIEGFNNGASEYLTKPFNYKLLLSRIKSLINEREIVKKSLQKRMDISPSEIDITPLDEKLISRAVKLVEKNISNADFSVEEMGRELGISRTHLYKKMVALTGKSPVEFIRLIRIKRASQLLEKSQLTVSEVSNEVGINNLKFFARYFKAEYNMLPSQYMKKFKSS
jgi:signal transduction histidine kinase/DNA-binding response OmpR family regulator